MREYYGAPNDFRNYLEHSLKDSKNKFEAAQRSARQEQLRNEFQIIARKYTQTLNRSNDQELLNKLRAKRNVYEACLTMLRNSNGGQLSDSQVSYLEQFIRSVRDILGTAGSTRLPGRR